MRTLLIYKTKCTVYPTEPESKTPTECHSAIYALVSVTLIYFFFIMHALVYIWIEIKTLENSFLCSSYNLIIIFPSYCVFRDGIISYQKNKFTFLHECVPVPSTCTLRQNILLKVVHKVNNRTRGGWKSLHTCYKHFT